MSDWSEGYVSAVDYTLGYYSEMNPENIRFIFAHQGLKCPDVGTACELGFGMGLSTAIHAAGSVTQWVGTDFLPNQALFAQELVDKAESDAFMFDQAFDEFAARDDLPDFDFIALHGIWSWVSDENRQIIVDFVRRKLKVGGVLYISYNTTPGWAPFLPFRNLMVQYFERLTAIGIPVDQRIDQSLEFLKQLVETEPAYTQQNPIAVEKLSALDKKERRYLAHEYFNRDWAPMFFDEIEELLSSAKLVFASSARYLDHLDPVALTTRQHEMISRIDDTNVRQSVKDLMVGRQFRADYWVKGRRELTAIERQESMAEIRVLLTINPDDFEYKIAGTGNVATLDVDVYGPVLDAIRHYEILSIAEIFQRVQAEQISFNQVCEIVLVLIGRGQAVAVQNQSAIEAARDSSVKLNFHLLLQCRSGRFVNYLSSPVSGGGVIVSEIEQMFLLGIANSISEPDGWAEFAWSILNSQGRTLLDENKEPMQSAEQNLIKLRADATKFQNERLAILHALEVV